MSYDLGTAHGKIVLDYNSDKDVGRAEDDIDKLERKARDADGTLGKLGKTLGAIGSGAKLGALAVSMTHAAAGAASLAIQIAGIVPALASILSLSSALPALYVGAAAAVGVMKAAFAGVGDVLAAAFDPKKLKEFQEGLKELSPAAQAFALQVKASVPAFKEYQQGLQEAFFSNAGLDKAVLRAVFVLGQLKTNLQGIAEDFGRLTKRFVEFATTQNSINFLNDSVANFRGLIQEASSALEPFLTGLRAVGDIGGSLLPRLGRAISDVGTRFGEWMSDIAASGQLQEWIDTAISTLQTLGGIVSNVGSILTSIFQAASDTGGGLLGTLQTITGEFAAFLNSAEGATAIRDLFSGIMEVARALAPVLTTLVGALAKALAPAIAQIANDLGPILLDVVERLAPAFAPLAAAAADLLSALAPLVPPIAQLVALLAGVLSKAIQALVAEFSPLIEIISGALIGAFEAFMPVIDAMAAGLPLAAEAGVALAQAFAPLVPIIVQLAQVFAESLIAVLPDLLGIAQQLIPVITQFATLMSDQLAESLNMLIAILPGLIQFLAAILPIVIQITTFGLRLSIWFMQFGAILRDFIGAVIQVGAALISGLVNGIVAAYQGVVSAGAAIINWFSELPGKIFGFIKALPSMLSNLFTKAIQGAAYAVGFGIGLIVAAVTKLPGMLLRALIAFPGMLANLFRNAWNALVRITTAGANAVINYFRQLPARTRSALASLGSLLASIGRNALRALVNAASSGANAFINFFRQLPGRTRSALGNLGQLLVSSGRAIIDGLIRGIRAGVDKVLGLIGDLANKIKGGFNDALSIFSPSREFKWSGQMIGEGLIDGLQSKLRAVAQMARTLAQTVIAPTVALPQTASATLNTVAPTAVQRIADRNAAAAGERTYHLDIDGRTIATIVIDTVTGNPKVVSKAANEGSRQNQFAGSGRR